MKYELFDYQDAAQKHVLRALDGMSLAYATNDDELGAIVLAAPTGAGKTVIATAVIESALDGDDVAPPIQGSTFLWVTDDPSLNKQTIQKMIAASSALAPNRLIPIENDFDQEMLDEGKIYFLNIQKLGAAATLSKGGIDGRTYSFWDTLANTIKQRPRGLVVVVDEAHRGTTARTTRDTIVSQIIGGGTTSRPAAPVVWGISATPKRFRELMDERGRTVKTHNVQIEDVRSSGLLKDQIILGHTRGIQAAESTLVRHGVAKIREYDAAWQAYCDEWGDPRVDPILVIQVDDKPSSKDLGDLVATVMDEWDDIDSSHIVHTFASHSPVDAGPHQIAYCPPEDIQDRHDVRIVLCKTAITTGWDCPRAEVLVSMRVARDVDLITQIMGRMVRTPLARRILTDETLNTVNCVLPKFDETGVDKITEQFERGDDGNLAGGTEVVKEPVVITRNPTLRPSTPASPSTTTDGSSNTGSGGTPGSVDDPSWFGATEPPITDPQPSRPGGTLTRPAQDGPSLMDEAPERLGLLPQGSLDVFGLLQQLPSYTIPRKIRRPGVSRLMSLAALLVEKHGDIAIEPTAINQARNALVSEVEAFRANLEARGVLEARIAEVSTTRLFERAVTYGSTSEADNTRDTTIELDTRGISILMDRARRALPEGIANAYVDRVAIHDADVTDAQIVTIALTQDVELPVLIEERASTLVAQWLQKYSSATTRLGPAEQEKFDRIRRESDRPLLTTFSVPKQRMHDAVGEEWDRHILSDENGKLRLELKNWEAHVLRTELDHGAIAWYRNPTGGNHALQIPYTAADGIRGVYPDFLFVHDIGGQLLASLVDPHGTHLADAVPKLKGISEYTARHGDAFHRIQSIANVDKQYRMLNLKDSVTRQAIDSFEGADAAELFRDHGVEY